MAYNTGNPIGSTDARDLQDNAQNFDEAINERAAATWTDRLGVARKTVWGAFQDITYKTPVSYATGLSFLTTDANKTVEESGVVYAPLNSALPFTTSGTFAGDDDARFYPVQDKNNVIRVTSIVAMEAYSAPAGYVFSLNAGGRSGTFDVVAGDFSAEVAADTLNGVYVGLADDPTASAKVAKRRFQGAASISWFGAVGDDSTDNAISIDAAASMNIPLFIPVGIFCTTGRHTFTASLNGVGPEHSVIKNIDLTTSSNGWLVTFQNVKDSVIGGFTVDGQTTNTAGTPNVDPASWDASNYDTWYGSRGVLFACERTNIYNVHAKNSGGGAGIRLQQCTDVALHNCYSERARGNFGDCYYSVAGLRINFTDCRAYDHTRIGFVSEGNFTSSRISTEIFYSGCTAIYGHDGGINYGGSEFSTGFWAENTDICAYANCHAYDMESTGFIYAPTTHITGKDGSTATYTGCTTNNTATGFQTGALSEGNVNTSYFGCSAYNTGNGFLANPKANAVVNVTWNSCHATCTGTGANSTAYSMDPQGAGDFTANIINCTSRWLDTSGLQDTSLNTADVSHFSTFAKTININGFTNQTTDASIKNRQSPDCTYNISNIANNAFIYLNSGVNQEVNITNCSIKGKIRDGVVKLSNVSVKTNEQISLHDSEAYGDINIINSDMFIFHNSGILETKRIVCDLTVNMQRDVATDDYGLRIQCEQTVKPTFVVNGIFYNSGAAAASDKNFIWVVRGGTKLLTNGLLKDDTVPNLYRINTSPQALLTAEQEATLH